MRMWMVDPKILCQKHLCGEHVETHMFLGTLRKRIKIQGYINNNLFQPKALKERHDVLSQEMLRRGYNHMTPLTFSLSDIAHLTEVQQNATVNVEAAFNELISRCPECSRRYEESIR